MRATTASIVMTSVILGGCFELPERPKDSAVDDTAISGGECPPDSVSGSLASVLVVDFVVNGLRLAPTPTSLCVFVDGYGARLGLTTGDESGQVVVKTAELGAWGVPDSEIEAYVLWDELSWAQSHFYTGSLVISQGGGDSGLSDTNGGGGTYVGFNGEATNGESQQLVLNVSWGG